MNIQPFYLKENTTWADLAAIPRLTPLCTEEEDDVLLETRIKKIFREHLGELGKVFGSEGPDGTKDDFAFECLWEHALRDRAIHWVRGDSLDMISFRRIGQALEGNCIFKGEGVSAQSNPEGRLHALTEYLLGRNDLPGELSGAEVRQILREEIAADPVNTCLLLQQELREVFENAANLEIPRFEDEPEREALFQMFIGHMISALPFAYPQEGDRFSIPVKIEGQWELKEYRIDERIELTPGPFTPLLAFGLVAENDLEGTAPPLLSFSGTTWGEGQMISILSDITPFMSVGHMPYLLGKGKIDSWIDRHSANVDVQLYGASLGGAICFHVLRHHKDRIGSVNVFNAPGLFPCLWDGPFDGEEHEINIYVQQNDIISTSGYFPTGAGVNVFRIIGEQSDGWREAHARGYGGGKRVTLIKSSPGFENSRCARTLWTGLHFVAGITIGVALWTFFLLACLYQVVKQKLIQCCYKQPQIGQVAT